LFPVSGTVALLAVLFFLSLAGAAAKEPKAKTGTTTLPADTVLYLHLQTAVSTKTFKQGQTVTASLAREAEVQGGVAIPFGSTLNGTIEKCSQPTASDQRAELLLSFGQLTIPGEGNLSLKGHLSGVSNARETLLADGTVVGVLESEAPASLLGGALQKLGQVDPSVNDQNGNRTPGGDRPSIHAYRTPEPEAPGSICRAAPTSCRLARLRGQHSGGRAKTRGKQR
jgi:hypothetical protein